jgi:hypothetical protein
VRKIVENWFKRDRGLCSEELVKPYFERAKQAILGHEFSKAVAHLDCGIAVAPNHLELYLHRAHIFQYGLNDYSGALRDYRFILKKLEARPDPSLAVRCREAMKDMMAGA